MLFSFSLSALAESFEIEAKQLAGDLKSSLVKNLTEKIEKDGAIGAIKFCHLNAKSIAKSAAGERIKKYEFGRTSHKIRNPQNKPQSWHEKYLARMIGKKKEQVENDTFIHQEKNHKYYLESLYVGPKCLACHGEQIAPEVKKEIQKLYPKDMATGFKLGEFRGFLWIKEKKNDYQRRN